jgi:uncharacterized protein (TIGR03083 family)
MVNTINSTQAWPHAAQINYVTADEAYDLMMDELALLIPLVESLDPEDWEKPTACQGWNVRDILAHQAGSYAGGTGYREMLRQSMNRPEPGQLPEDAINAFQLRERAEQTPQELIEELRRVGPIAAKNWAYHFFPLKLLNIPHPVAGKLSMRHLMWVIHSRDTWMHRMDICRATNRKFEQKEVHDSRIVELVMMDVADALAVKFNGPALVFDLAGIGGGLWKAGTGDPAAIIQMDVLEFNIFASGRYSYKQARSMMNVSGDTTTAEEALKTILVVY